MWAIFKDERHDSCLNLSHPLGAKCKTALSDVMPTIEAYTLLLPPFLVSVVFILRQQNVIG